MNESEKLNTINSSKNGRETKRTETPEVEKKAKRYIKSILYGALEKGALGGVSVISFFLWLIKKCGEKVKKDAMSEIKGLFKAFK